MFKFKRDAILFLIGNFLLGFGFAGFRLLFNLYLKETGFGEGKIGLLLASMTYATMIMIFPASFIVRKIKIGPLFISVVIFSALGYLIPVLVEKFSQMLLGIIIAGIFSAFFSVISGPFIMQTSTPRERTHLFSMNFAVSLMSGIFGNILAGNIPLLLMKSGIALQKGYKMAIIIHIFLSLLSLIPFSLIGEEKVVEDSEIRNFFHINTPKGLILKLSIPHILVGLGAGLTIPFLNLYFRDRFLLDSAKIGYLFSSSQFMMIAGTLFAPFLARLFGKIKTVIISQILSVPFLFILSVTHNLPLAIISFLLRATLMNMAQPLVMNFSLEVVDKNDRPFLSGVLNMAWLSAWGVSSNIGGKIIENTGYFIPFNLTLTAYVISSILYALLLMPLEKSESFSKNY